MDPQWPLPGNDPWSTPFAEALLNHLDIFPGAAILDIASGTGIPAFFSWGTSGPWKRGKKKRQVIYKSKSALDAIYSGISVKSETLKRPKWFRFERDCLEVLSNIGFEVQHNLPSRGGDGGIDIFASKENDSNYENWIIQCKCWNPNNKVGPNVIRELIGSLDNYSENTHGMIITTSGFSSGARQLAKDKEIQLIDGEEFSRLLKNWNRED